ncbi:MAG: hypothetical protein U0269_13885 [Polyangiales bacterium]
MVDPSPSSVGAEWGANMTRELRTTVSFSLKDRGVRRTITLPEGAALVVRVEGDLAAVRVRLLSGAMLIERLVNHEERARGWVELGLDSLQLDRWGTIEVLSVEAREVLAAHHRSATHEAPWMLLSTLTVRGARARVALWLSAALGLSLALLWGSVFTLAASRARFVADLAGALLCASAGLPVLGLGRRYAPSVAMGVAALALAGSTLSWRNTTTVFNPPDEMQGPRSSLPSRLSRWMSYEARPDGEHQLRIAGARVDRGGRCEASEARWPAFTLGTDRVALASGAWVEITVGAASILGIARHVSCDSMGHCCLRVRDERLPAELRLDSTRDESAQAEVELRSGPPIDASLGRLLAAPTRIRLSAGRSFESVRFENDAQPNLTLTFRPAAERDSLLVGMLGRGWRGEARWPDRQRSSFECPSRASRLTEYRAALGTITRIEGRGWSADLSRSSRALACSADDAQELSELVTLVVGDPRRGGGIEPISELWQRNASELASEWSVIRMVRREANRPEVLLSETTRPVLRAVETQLVAAELSSTLREAEQIQLRWPGRTLLLWRRREQSPPAVLLNLPTRVARGSSLYAFFVTVREGATTRVAIAALSRTPHGYRLEEVGPSAAPSCCRAAGELAYCDELSPMTRLPPRRELLAGVQAEGCGAVFETRGNGVIRDPVRR